MRKISLLILLFVLTISSNCFSQSLVFEKIVQVDSTKSKEILFERLNSKLIDYYGGQNSFNKNIIQSDKENGVIKIKQEMRYSKNEFMNSANGVIDFNINVFFKKGRCKVLIDNITHTGMGISMGAITEDKEYPHTDKDYLKFRKRKWIEIKDFIYSEMPKKILMIEKILNTPLEQENEW
ncbi:DUF4468 domain-containing protein [Flavobacterium sp. FlaQc-30]|uniref:DUF4468 domain-containing protein n=1 Tax=Flavobacterium sp. FlaQc-30 TaxID=3374179 RepID=UPI003757855E